MSRLRKFLALPHADRGCLLEAAFWLGLARLSILILPFRRIAPVLGRHMAQSPEKPGAAPAALLDRISWAVATASRHLPWKCLCLVQAMAGKAMLKCRGGAQHPVPGAGQGRRISAPGACLATAKS